MNPIQEHLTGVKLGLLQRIVSGYSIVEIVIDRWLIGQQEKDTVIISNI